MKARVVATGMDAITPVGNGMKSFWQGLRNKTVGIGPITYFDTTEYKYKLTVKIKGFDPKQYVDAKAARRMETFSQLAVTASKEAPEQSGIDMEKENPYRVGVCVGSGIGSLQAIGKDMKKLNGKGPSRVNPFLVPLMISNMTAGNVTIQFGPKEKCFNMVTAYITGTHSIGEALRSTQYGKADVMVVGRTEVNIAPIDITEFTPLTVLSTTEGVSRASIPLDKDRNGFVMGERADAIALKSPEYVKARGTNVLTEVVRYGAACDAFRVISPAKDGSGAIRVMENAMKDADITAEDIDYVNAHGTSTHHNGLFETKAIKLVLRSHAQKVKINSTKSMIGHPLGAIGGVKFITYIKSIQNGLVHATVGLRRPGEDCDPDYTIGDGVPMNVGVAISSSLGFSGHNTSLTVKKFDE